MKHIQLSGKKGAGRFALVDDSEYEILSRERWYLNTDGYAVSGQRQAMHRAVLSAGPGLVVDHINRQKLDNRSSNLRVCTPKQNVQNQAQKRSSSLLYKGVTRAGNGHYRATQAGKNLGLFATPEAAARAYNESAVRNYGEFACINDLAP